MDQLSTTFAALADPTRREILSQLSEGGKSVNELAAPFEMTLPAISKHLKVLEKAGLIQRSRAAQSRPCHISPQPLAAAAEWVQQYRDLWEQRLDRLDDYLQELQRKEKKRGSRK